MLEYVGADGVMIGRAALGNPWMIQRTKEYLETGELMPEPSPAEKINIAKVHLQRLVDLKGEKIADPNDSYANPAAMPSSADRAPRSFDVEAHSLMRRLSVSRMKSCMLA